jgi:hypothetical protein
MALDLVEAVREAMEKLSGTAQSEHASAGPA